jgi:hypothetical protein
VLTPTTYNGNLGGRSGADAACLTELATTHTTWQGYSTANSNGQLVADKVHAFVTISSVLNALMPLTTYYFAYAGKAINWSSCNSRHRALAGENSRILSSMPRKGRMRDGTSRGRRLARPVV